MKVKNLRDLCFACPDGTIGVEAGFCTAEFNCKSEKDRLFIYTQAAKIGCSVNMLDDTFLAVKYGKFGLQVMNKTEYKQLVRHLYHYGYSLKKKPEELTDGEIAMYDQMAQKCCFKAENNTAVEFYTMLQEIMLQMK